MKVIGTKKEIEFLEYLIEESGINCNNCLYKEGCGDDPLELCCDYILSKIDIEIAKE